MYHTILFLFYFITEKKLQIEFSEPVQIHDFRPLRLSKNEISPDAEVLEHYMQL